MHNPKQISIAQFSGVSSENRDETVAPRRKTYELQYVRSLFNRIAPRYDLLNHLLSSGIDVLWRKRAVQVLKTHRPADILDVATGTGDLAIEAARLRPRRIVGIDIAGEMLARGEEKAMQKGLEHLIHFQEGNAESLPFPDHSFDAVTIAFGVRNFERLDRGLSEMYRVLRHNGAVLILEFSRPRLSWVKRLYALYSRIIVPTVGAILSDPEAYQYLPSTIKEFPDGKDFAGLLEKAGFINVQYIPLTFGIATIYHGNRSNDTDSKE